MAAHFLPTAPNRYSGRSLCARSIAKSSTKDDTEDECRINFIRRASPQTTRRKRIFFSLKGELFARSFGIQTFAARYYFISVSSIALLITRIIKRHIVVTLAQI